MDKSPDAFRTISEVAEDLDLPQHVLRFWETRFNADQADEARRRPPLLPAAGCRSAQGHPPLLYDQGYTIKGVQKLLRENGNHFLVAIGNGDMAAVEAISQRKQADAGAADAGSAAARQDDECWSASPRRSPAAAFSASASRGGRPGPAGAVETVARQPRAAAGGAVRPPGVQAPARPGALDLQAIDRPKQKSEPVLRPCVWPSLKRRKTIMVSFSTLSDLDLEKQVATLSKELAACAKSVAKRGGAYYEDGRDARRTIMGSLPTVSGRAAGNQEAGQGDRKDGARSSGDGGRRWLVVLGLVANLLFSRR